MKVDKSSCDLILSDINSLHRNLNFTKLHYKQLAFQTKLSHVMIYARNNEIYFLCK